MAKRRRGKSPGRIRRGLEVRAGWWDRLMELPLLWGVVAVLLSAWLLMPGEIVDVPRWSPGDVAEYDVVVPRDVALPDASATAALRSEARENVLPVYDLEPRLAGALNEVVRSLLGRCREQLAAGELDAEELAAGSDLALSESALETLRSADCAGSLEDALVKVIERTYAAGVVDDRRLLERRGRNGFVRRDLASGEERVVSLDGFAGVGLSGLRDLVRSLLLEESAVDRVWLKPLTDLLVANMPPNLVFNAVATASRRETAAEQVTERMQLLKRGQVLVRRGDRVTPTVAQTLQRLASRGSGLEWYAGAVGVLLLVTVVALGWWRLVGAHPVASERRYRLSAVFVLMAVTVAVDRLAVFLANAAAMASHGASGSPADAYLWGIPHALGPLAALLLLGAQPAVLFAFFQALAAGIMLGGEFTVVPYALTGGLAVVIASSRVRQTAVLTRVGLHVGVAQLVMYGILQLYMGATADAWTLGFGALFALLSGPVAVALAGFILPILETAFGITTDLRLVELSSQNLPLLRRLSTNAPGTFQHSLAVAHLAEAGADAVGANTLLVRVCAYYHDIGKLQKPDYFVENQRGGNPHDSLAPSMSALVLMSHVKEGLDRARREKLPLPIRQAIATHHGTKIIQFFYSKAVREAEENGLPPVSEREFRYPGPRPHTKEMGILLLADAVEAASRTLEKPTQSKIQSMIGRIFTDIVRDGQLDDADITMKELDRIGSAFSWVLNSRYHRRVDYPGFDFNRKAGSRDSGAHRLAQTTERPGG